MVIEIRESDFIRGIKEAPIGEAIWDIFTRVAPFHALLKIYSAFITTFDAVFCCLYCILSIIESVFGLLFPPASKSVSDEVAVIVGAGRGIGRDIALTLGSMGAMVVCIDKNTTLAEHTRKAIQLRGGRAFAYTLDVTKRDQVKHTVALISEEVGQIGMIFHCCGIPSPRALTAEAPPVSNIIDVGVTSHFWLIDEVLPRMKANKHGHIVLLSSVAGLSSIQQNLAMGVSQFAVHGIFESLEEDIRINELEKYIKVSICHVYPFIISDEMVNDIELRIPSYFGCIEASKAAAMIVEGVRRDMAEFSIPKYLLYLSNVMRLLPRKSVCLIRGFLGAGIDFG